MAQQSQQLYKFGPFRIDLVRRLLLREGVAVQLTPKAFDLLAALVESAGEVVSKDELIKRVWPDSFVEEGNLTYNMSVLRKALGERAGEHHYVVTVPGRGYRFVADLTTEASEQATGETRRRKYVPTKFAPVALALALVALAAVGYLLLAPSERTPIRTVAVLPFANGSDSPDMEYLSDGISESLINSLSQLPGLKVTARNSSFKYKGKEINPQEVARALGVEAILEGRVAQRGENLLISVELMDARDETQVWGEQYNRKMADLQALQEEMARTISQKLRLHLTGAQEQRLAKRATENPRAYDAYLNGLFSNRKDGIQHVRKALDYFNEAIALDTNFAPAYVNAAWCYNVLANNSVLDPAEAHAKAKAALQRALELDETLAEAHAELAAIKTDEWDWAGAEHDIKRAIELTPNSEYAHDKYAWYLSAIGRHEEALAEIKRAQELDPLSIGLKANEGFHLFLAGRYEEAIQKLQQVIKLEPNDSRPHVLLGFTYTCNGMYAEAIAEHRKAISLAGETTSELCYLGHALAKSGRHSEALSILAKLKRAKDYISPYELATLYLGLGDEEKTLELLEKAYAEHDLQMQYVKVDPHLSSLRQDARFQDLLRRVGLQP